MLPLRPGLNVVILGSSFEGWNGERGRILNVFEDDKLVLLRLFSISIEVYFPFDEVRVTS
jgi:hypothetical protein